MGFETLMIEEEKKEGVGGDGALVRPKFVPTLHIGLKIGKVQNIVHLFYLLYVQSPLKTYTMIHMISSKPPQILHFFWIFFRALYYSSPSIPIITAGNYSPSLKATIKVQSSAVVSKVMVDFSSSRPIVFKFL